MKAEHIFIPNGLPGGIAPGSFILLCVNIKCPAVSASRALFFPAHPGGIVSVTDGTEVYENLIHLTCQQQDRQLVRGCDNKAGVIFRALSFFMPHQDFGRPMQGMILIF